MVVELSSELVVSAASASVVDEEPVLVSPRDGEAPSSPQAAMSRHHAQVPNL
jgi:hypothetical protein